MKGAISANSTADVARLFWKNARTIAHTQAMPSLCVLMAPTSLTTAKPVRQIPTVL
jgi:hypothetical protein